MKSDKRFVEAHLRSAKHQRVSFIKLKVARHFQNMLYQNLYIWQLRFVSFQQNKLLCLFSNTVYEYALHSTFQLITQKIDMSK